MRRIGLEIDGHEVRLHCGECGFIKNMLRKIANIDDLLDREAEGWYTVLAGTALCPNCTIKRGLADEPATLTTRVCGRAQNKDDIRRIIESAAR